MIILTGKDLEQQGIPYRAASRITLRNRMFVKGQSFAPQLRQAAVDLCKSYQKSGLQCLLVDSGGHLTIWRQDQSSHNTL
jgi:hypothetical protein